MLVGYAVILGVTIWNNVMKQGNTGRSIGKGMMGIKVVGLTPASRSAPAVASSAG